MLRQRTVAASTIVTITTYCHSGVEELSFGSGAGAGGDETGGAGEGRALSGEYAVHTSDGFTPTARAKAAKYPRIKTPPGTRDMSSRSIASRIHSWIFVSSAT
jgi:hypothetical protein